MINFSYYSNDINNHNQNEINENPYIVGNNPEFRDENIANILNSYSPYQSFNINNNNYNSNDYSNDIFFNDNPNIKLEDKSLKFPYISDSDLFKINDSFKEDINTKFLLYLKNNDLIYENNILEKDFDINKERKNFEEKNKNILEEFKCYGCSKIPNDFYICSKCHIIFCENCLGKESEKNKKQKFCINCHKLIFSKEHFINIPIFNKILSYINSSKENNEKLFNNRIKDNINRNVILCSEEIHKNKKEDKFFIFNINNIENINEEGYINKNNEMKATYFCMDCLKPFCSDCILNYKLKNKNNKNNKNIKKENNNNENNNIDNKNNENNTIDNKNNEKNNIDNNNNEKNNDINNNNEKNNDINNNNENVIDIENKKDNISNSIIENEDLNKHNINHRIFKIEFLKDVGIFDLLYEKTKTQEIISELDSIDIQINDKIEDLNINKQRIILFIDYIKNIYIQKIDEIIIKLRNISKEKYDKITLIKQKEEELSNFLNILKTKNDFKDNKNINSIKKLLSDFNTFHKIPYEIKKKSFQFIKIKGLFNLEELNNVSMNVCLNDSFKKKVKLNNSNIKIKFENCPSNKEINENNENKIIQKEKIMIEYNKKENNNDNRRILNEYYYSPILINYNKNEFIILKEVSDDVNQKKPQEKKNKEINDFNLEDSISYNSDPFLIDKKYDNSNSINEEENNEKKYLAEINTDGLKKMSDEFHSLNFEIYNFYIF